MERYQYKSVYCLRFIFALLIVFCHLFIITSVYSNPIFDFIDLHRRAAGYAVNFFFILSGFFFAYTLDISQDTFVYIKKRLARLWPVVAFYTVCLICMDNWHMPAAEGDFYHRIYSLFLLNGIGLTNLNDGVSWFVSALFFSSLFIFYLYKSFSNKIANFVLGIIVLFCFIILANAGDIPSLHYTVLYKVFPIPILRGVGGMGLGVFLFYTYSYFNKTNIKKQNNQDILLYGFAEIFLLLYSIYLVTFAKWDNDNIVIICYLLLLYVFLLNKGFLSRLLDNNFSVALGKYSYSIFLTHILIIFLTVYLVDLNNPLVFNHALLFIILLYLVIIGFGIITYHFIEKPTNNFYNKVGFKIYYLVIFGSILILSSFAYIAHNLFLQM